ncbi:radial spoke head 10 homolog B-like isoform X2 [Cimex lectularius]|uniref:Uncharacterized protein n=1 Tax=Cimex lectularius TaxID=79782 RepID=A0A8I6S2V0_CIMLE|nr:radial spoke head 10 homolog B-like isoform X2 [Cimex lectularius]
MSFWLTEEKTISQENIKGSSSESPPPSLSSKPEDSFILEPDIILANDKVYFPDEEIAANFLSILAVHIIKSIKSEECQRKVYKPVLRVIYQELNKEKEGECESLIISSLPSVESGKCFSKNKRKKRVSRVYRTFSKSSTHTLNSKPSRQTINSIPNLETNFEEDNDAPCEEEELKACPEEAYPSNSYLYSFYLEQKLHNWTFKERDQEVEILFQNGNRYIGRISRMQMEGEGKFIWQDGTIYKGMFKSGCAHGKGEIFYPDCSWYDGEIAYNKRHGNGIMRKFSSSGDCYYYGQWFKGKKHGKGTAIYNKNVWYEGKWKYGKRDGFGIMHYASGAVYCGEWSKGNKSGYGTMIWNNNDVYCGEWSFGSMHGLGRYTWRAFKNLQFVSPQMDTFTGNFVEGKRQGFGHLCLASGASIYTSWYNRDKCGSGEVICCNGNKLKDRNLFYQDRAVQVDLFNSINLPEDMSDDIELLNLMSDEELARRVKPRSLNVNAPLHEMDFSMHINELFKIDYNLSIPQSEGDPVCIIDYNERTEVIKLEKMWLKRVIMKRMTDLRSVYNFYAAIGVDNKPTKFSIFMLRIMLHQLLRDCGITKTKYSCVDLDQMVGIGNDPFENVLMYEMIHYLITLCILTRMSPRQKNEGIPGVLAGTFDRFIDEVVIKSKDNYNALLDSFWARAPQPEG